jgi:formylmethanofuran dehydrogenase subunit E
MKGGDYLLEAYKIMPDNDLFDVMEVHVKVKPEVIPGKPLRRIRCDSCGGYVQDQRGVQRNRRVFCKPCADTGYYEPVGQDIF